jgi:hypothetical protein
LVLTRSRASRRLRAASDKLSTAMSVKNAARSDGLAFEKLMKLPRKAWITRFGRFGTRIYGILLR